MGEHMQTSESQIAVLRVDGNSYAAYEVTVYELWDFVPMGGVIIFDDFGHRYAQKFWRDFQFAQKVTLPMTFVDRTGAWMIKTGPLKLDQSGRQNKTDERT